MHMKKIFSLASALILAATFLSVQPAPARAADSAAAMEAYTEGRFRVNQRSRRSF